MCTCTFLVILSCVGCGKAADPLEDRPLGPNIHFSAIHSAEGKDQPRQLIIRGRLDDAGQLELNPNHLMLGPDGNIMGTTALGWTPIPVQIKKTDRADPDKKKRAVYDIVLATEGQKRTYSLVLSPNEAGPHDLLIMEGGKVIGQYSMVDPDRQSHQRLASELAKASPEEQQAIAKLRKIMGYSFSFRLEANDAVTYLYFPDGVDDISKLDPALQGLKNLGSLGFIGGQLGPKGLKSIGKMSSLKVLSFKLCDIDDAGLACLEETPQLKHLSFYGSQGLTDDGLAHFKELKNLTLLDLRNESFTATEPKTARVTDAGLKHLAGLTKLEYLNLQGQHITDDGLKHLSEMKNLQELSLSFSGITDEGLKHLEGLPKLSQLHIYSNRVTAKGLAALKAKLPMLRP